MTSTTSQAAADFSIELNVAATPTDVLALFTSAGAVSRWWGPSEGDAEVGGILITSFGEHGVNAVRVLESGPTRVVWESVQVDGTVPTAHTQEWLGTTMEFDVVASDGGTQLRLRHRGLTAALDCWDACSSAWTYFAASIRATAQTGTGTPFQD